LNIKAKNSFEELMQYLHVSDNDNLMQTDRFANIRPLFTALNTKFLDALPYVKNLSVDESMVL